MDFLDLIKQLQTHLGVGHPYTQMSTPDATYGPAVTRFTNTPVAFTTDMESPGNRGEYDSATNAIKINPSITPDVQEVTRHETIHALLNYLNPEHAQQVVQDSPNYNSIADSIHASGLSPNSSSSSGEAAAYMGQSPTSQIKGVSDAQHDEFLKGLRTQLSAVHPQLGFTLQRIIDSGRSTMPPPINVSSAGQ